MRANLYRCLFLFFTGYLEEKMDIKKSYCVATDGTAVPCLAEYAFQSRNEDPATVASVISAFLHAAGGTDANVDEVYGALRGQGYLDLEEGKLVASSQEHLRSFNATADCISAMTTLFNREPKFCAACPVCDRLRPHEYTNRYAEDERELLALLFSSALKGDYNEILNLGDPVAEQQTSALKRLFSSIIIVQDERSLVRFQLNYLLFYALYYWCKDQMPPNVENAESIAHGVISILESRQVPGYGVIKESLVKYFLASESRKCLSALCDRIKYTDRQDPFAAFRLLDAYNIKVFSDDQRTSILGDAMLCQANGLPAAVEPKFAEGSEEEAAEPKASESTASSTKPTATNADSSSTKQEATAEPPVQSSSENGTTPKEQTAETVDAAETDVTVASVNDDGVDKEATQPSLSKVKTEFRSVNHAVHDRGVSIEALSSTGKPYTTGVLGPDNLINPYVVLGTMVKLPREVEGLTPFTLAVTLETAVFYTVEYAICNKQEGFLCYFYQRNLMIFVSREDYDYFNVILASFRRSVPKKLTMLAAPLLDYLYRMGEVLHRGVIPVYDAYRLAKHYEVFELLPIKNILTPGTKSLPAAIRQYGMIWKRTGLTAADMEPAVNVASVYASSNYALTYTGSRYPHLYHDEVTYQLNWQSCQLAGGFLMVRLTLDPSQLTSAEIFSCYSELLQLLGRGIDHRVYGFRLLTCDVVSGFSYMIPLASYPWAHNLLFLRVGNIARKLTGRGINVTEDVMVSKDGKVPIFDTKIEKKEDASSSDQAASQ